MSPALARHRRTSRAKLYRRLDRSGAPVSWGLRLFNGEGEQQITVLLPNPFLDQDSDRCLQTPEWSRLGLWDSLRARWLGFTEPDPIVNFGAKHIFALNGILASTVAFLSAFGVYEGLLFISSMIFQNGIADYAPAIVGRIFAINAVAFIGLLVVNRLGVSAGLAVEPRRQLVATGRRS